MKKMRSIISKNIVRTIYCGQMLMLLLFLLKLEVLKKMETHIQNHGIKLCWRFLFYFRLSVTKGYWELKLSKNNVILMAFKRRGLRNSWKFVDVGFYETPQILILVYAWILFFAFGFYFKKIAAFAKNSETSTLRCLIPKHYIPKMEENFVIIASLKWQYLMHIKQFLGSSLLFSLISKQVCENHTL